MKDIQVAMAFLFLGLVAAIALGYHRSGGTPTLGNPAPTYTGKTPTQTGNNPYHQGI